MNRRLSSSIGAAVGVLVAALLFPPSAGYCQTAPKTLVPDPALAGLTADAAKDAHALERYEQAIRRLLQLEQYGKLDDIAGVARRTKARFAGGTWKLYVLYRGLREPAEGLKASEEDWNLHLGELAAWGEQNPASVTAKIALAEAFFRYAEKERARYDASREPNAERLAEDPWAVIHERLHAAQLALNDASELPTKCPHWYFVRQELEGKPDEALLHEAVAFEPDYYPYYRLHAMLLL